jgi:hypothetical protein
MSYIKDILFQSLTLTGLDGSPADLGGEITTLIAFDYYESIFEPTVKVTSTFVGLEQLLATKSFRGTEKLSFSIKHPSGVLSFNDLIIQSMQQNDSSSTSNLYTILATSPDAIKNYEKRLTQRYDPSVKISTHVSSILGRLGSSRPADIESTSNSLGFYGNYWTPFKALYWLAKRSASGTGSSDGSGTSRVGFLFWENQFGYNFKSIDTIAEQSKTNIIQQFDQTDTVNEIGNSNDFNVFNARFERDQNIIDQIAKGMYSDDASYYNLQSLGQSIQVPSQKLSYGDKVFSGQSHFGGDASLGNYDFNSSMNFLSVQFLVDGTMNREGKQQFTNNPDGEENIHKIKGQSRMRYASMMARSLRITVPLNFQLAAGLPIQVNLIQSNTGSSKHQSGVFIIKDLRHNIEMTDEGIKGFTHLRLLSDTYGSDDKVTTNASVL